MLEINSNPTTSFERKINEKQEDDSPSSSSRWRANEQLTNFLDTSRNPQNRLREKQSAADFPDPTLMRLIHPC